MKTTRCVRPDSREKGFPKCDEAGIFLPSLRAEGINVPWALVTTSLSFLTYDEIDDIFSYCRRESGQENVWRIFQSNQELLTRYSYEEFYPATMVWFTHELWLGLQFPCKMRRPNALPLDLLQRFYQPALSQNCQQPRSFRDHLSWWRDGWTVPRPLRRWQILGRGERLSDRPPGSEAGVSPVPIPVRVESVFAQNFRGHS